MNKSEVRSPIQTPSSTGKTPGFLRRMWESFKLARDLGKMQKAYQEQPGFMLRRMDEFSSVFLGETGWLTGNLPLQPKLEEGEPPRKFQYQPGYNIQIQPRSTEEITFAQLRQLGEYTLVRIVIERIKEAIKSHEWDITVEEGLSTDTYAGEIAFAKDFFECPDKRHAWDEWVGLVMEEVLVIDALSVYLHRSRAGQLWALEVIDGGTIKPLIDERGFEPLPPAPAYQQFLYGVPYVNMTRQDLIYRPRNRRANKFYGYSPVEQIVVTVNQGFRRELYNLAQFTDGNIPSAFGQLPADWKAEEIKQWQQYWDAVLSGDPQNRSRIRWLPGGQGVGITKMRDEEVFGLFNKFDEWLARIVTYAFGMSPISFVQMTNRAVAQELGDVEAEQGVASVKLFIERLVNEVIDDHLMMPFLRFNWVTDRARMAAKTVDRNVRYVEKGILQLDEVRAEEGLPPLGLPPGMVTPGGFVPFNVPPPAPPQVDQYGAADMVEPGIGEGSSTPGYPEENPDFREQPTSLPAYPDAFEAEQHVIGPVGYKALMVARDNELSAWKTYAEKRAKRGESTAGFRPEFHNEHEAKAINAELSKAATLDAIRHVFASRRKRLPEVRLAPPRAGEAAHLRNDLKTALRSVLEAEALRIAQGKG